jgi:hypothetical protein
MGANCTGYSIRVPAQPGSDHTDKHDCCTFAVDSNKFCPPLIALVDLEVVAQTSTNRPPYTLENHCMFIDVHLSPIMQMTPTDSDFLPSKGITRMLAGMSVPQIPLPVHAFDNIELAAEASEPSPPLSSLQSNMTHPGSSAGESHTSTTSKPEMESEKPRDIVCSLVGICVRQT